MLHLHILRHARALSGQQGVTDSQRGLHEEGIADLRRLGDALARFPTQPRVIYYSPARRTRMTLEEILPAFRQRPETIAHDPLYNGGLDDYYACIRNHSRPEPLMLIGHNPFCAELALRCAGDGEADALARLRTGYPAGALAVVRFDVQEWGAAGAGLGYLTDFLTPRELAWRS